MRTLTRGVKSGIFATWTVECNPSSVQTGLFSPNKRGSVSGGTIPTVKPITSGGTTSIIRSFIRPLKNRSRSRRNMETDTERSPGRIMFQLELSPRGVIRKPTGREKCNSFQPRRAQQFTQFPEGKVLSVLRHIEISQKINLDLEVRTHNPLMVGHRIVRFSKKTEADRAGWNTNGA